MLSKIFTTVKYTLICVTFLFLITGIIILAVGSSVQKAYNDYNEFLPNKFFTLPAFCIATGLIIFLIAFLGFCGAFTEKYYMIMAFVGAMVLMLIFQISACIAGYSLKSNTIALVQQQLKYSMSFYGNASVEITKLWDEVQYDFECCGVDNASDWSITNTDGLPVSCCPHIYGTIHTFNCTVESAYATGCSDAFGNWVKGHAAAIGVAGIFLVLMQGLAVAGAFWIAKISREERAHYP